MATSLEEVESSSLGSLGVVMDEVITNLSASWDPLSSSDWDKEKPSKQCILRIKRDIMSIYNEPPPCMCIVPDKDDITRIHALITGPFDTPYEGGFFYYLIRCPPDYPIRPPRVKLMTTGSGQVRFNPNTYKNGKVCLSILGTWSGPAWSPAQSLSSVLISIQSLMNEKPYHNEPGFERERMSGDVERYNDIIQHETLRVAVCEMLENKSSCPSALREVMEKSFTEYFDYYKTVCMNHMHKEGQSMQDPFGEKRGNFNYGGLLKRLEAIKINIAESNEDSSEELSDSDMDTSTNESFSESPDKHKRNFAESSGFNESGTSQDKIVTNSDETEKTGESMNSNKQIPSASQTCDNTNHIAIAFQSSDNVTHNRKEFSANGGPSMHSYESSVDPPISYTTDSR